MRMGIDLGGTKIEAAVLDETGAIVARKRVPTPAGGYRDIVNAAVGLVIEIERCGGWHCSIGVGIPGALSRVDSRVMNANTVVLNGQPIDRDLERALGRSVRVSNDANCFTVSEASDGAARGAGVAFGVILGTGVGGGIALRGKVLDGANAIAGEWGHMPLPAPTDDERPGPRCYCGRFGCVETWLSGPGLARDHRRHTGESLDAAAIAAGADAGDAGCNASLERYEERLARALSVVINILDPDAIVLGGGLSQVDRLYRNVPMRWATHVFCDQVVTRLVPPAHGDSSGVRGAAWLWP